MRQIITYIANNGEEFDTEEECIAYEKMMENARRFVMLDADGSKTDDIEETYFVFLHNEDEIVNFIEYNKVCGCCTDGLCSAYSGLYAWDEDTERWIRLSPSRINAICKVNEFAKENGELII